jgi:hypothetical protein
MSRRFVHSRVPAFAAGPVAPAALPLNVMSER